MVQSRSWTHGDKPTEVAEVKRLMIVADNSFAAQSIRLSLRQTAGFEIVGFLDGSAPISDRVSQLAPDVVIVDDTHEPEAAITRLEELTATLPAAQRVFLTIRMDGETQESAFAAGADAIISKAVH